MFRDAAWIARKDLRYSLRLPQVWFYMFVMPLVLSYAVGSLMQSIAGKIERIAIYAPPDAGFLAADLERRLSASGYQVVRAADRNALRRYPLWLAIPDGFTKSVLSGPPAQIELAYPAGYYFAGFETFRVGRAANELLADLVVLSKDGRALDAAQLSSLAGQPRKIQLQVESAGRKKKLILGFQQSVPGFIVMFTMFVALTSGSVLLIAERRAGVLRRLASAPIRRESIVLGKLSSRLAIGLLQVGVAMLVGKFWFGVDWGGPNLWAVLLLLAAYTTLCAALALAFASVTRSESQALAAGVIASNVMAAIGGCWWPVEIVPPWMQQAALFLPAGWAMDGLHRLIGYGDAPVSVAPHIVGLVLAAVAVGCAAARRFRFVE